MPLDQSLFPVLTPAKVEYEAATRPTGFGEYLGAKAQQGFDYSIAGRITERMTSPSPALGPLPAGNTPEQNADMGFKPGRRVTEDEWKKLKLDRPGLAFSGGGTVEYEQARTAAYDERRYRDRIVERYQGGFLGQAAGFAASLVGSVPSPENFVPFVGQATRAAMVARMGRIGGMAAAGALDATIGTAVADSFVLPDLASRGEDVGAADFALDLALGAVVGTAFGAGGGVLARRADARVRREQLAQAARAVRIDGLERQADALEVAMRAVADDEPVDVGPVVADALPKVQERAAQQSAAGSRFDAVFTAAGRSVPVEYQLVEASSLIASNTDELTINPAFPPELQPRDRTRAASGAQIQTIAGNLEPRLLGRSATAADGAPIIGPDGVVESGNGRVLAIRRAYQEGMQGAQAYREFLAREGFDPSGMQAPVLVRRRIGEMSPADRAAFAREANQRTTAAMGVSEQALSDAGGLDDRTMSLLGSGDLGAASNRSFVRAFVGSLPESERGGLLTASGELSRSGEQRVRAAVLARAYGDGGLLARIAEEPESGLGSLGQALADVAPKWARMRAEAAAGAIASEGDGTNGLLEAVRAVVAQRDRGDPLHFALDQTDLLAPGGGSALSPDGRAFLTAFLRRDAKGGSRLLGRQRIAEVLDGYIDAARAQQPGADMFGNSPRSAAGLLGGSSQIDLAAKAAPPDPHPSVVEAEASVTRAPPKTGIEEAQRLAADMALDDPPELADIAVMKRDGLLTAADEASLERANEVVKEADGWAEAYKTLATCSLRFGQ